MHRHSTDLTGLLFGLAFAIAGTSFLVRETTDTTIDPAWAIGLGLMLLGAVALVVTLARAVDRDGEGSTLPELPDRPDLPEFADARTPGSEETDPGSDA